MVIIKPCLHITNINKRQKEIRNLIRVVIRNQSRLKYET